MSDNPVTVEQALMESMRYPKDNNRGTVYTLRDGSVTHDRDIALEANEKEKKPSTPPQI